MSISQNVSIDSYGGDPTGSSDSSGAFLAALSAINMDGCITFGSGTYLFNSPIVATLNAGRSSISLNGNGQGATALYWPNGNGLTLVMCDQAQSVHIQDLAILTGSAGQGIGLTVSQSTPLLRFHTSTFERVTFRGNTNTAATYWKVGALITNVCGTSWESVTMHGGQQQGTGILFQGTGPSNSNNYSIYHNVDKCIFNELSHGIEWGSYAQGLTVTQTNIQNTLFGLYSSTSSNNTGQSQINIFDCQLMCGSYAIYLNASDSNITISGNDFIVPVIANSGAISIKNCQLGVIANNNINALSNNNSFGLVVDSSIGIVVNDNVISGFGVGVLLQPGSASCLVQDNSYTWCTNSAIDQGTNNRIFRDNAKPTASVTVGASPFTYTASASPEVHYISGGSVSSIVKNGCQIASTTGVSVSLSPHETYTVTYNSMPTIAHDVN